VDISITPSVSTSRFSPKKNVAYKLFIKNGIPKTQEGQIRYSVIDEKGNEINKKSYDITVPANKQLETMLNISHGAEGDFRIKFVVVLNKTENKFDFKFNFSDGKSRFATSPKKEKSEGPRTGHLMKVIRKGKSSLHSNPVMMMGYILKMNRLFIVLI